MPGLTKKQELFAFRIAKGDKGATAYRVSHNTSKMMAKTVHEEASRLLRNPKVAARVEELRAPALKAAKIDIDRWFEEAGKYAFGVPSTKLAHSDKRGYLDMVGRSLGAYKEDNVQRGESITLKVEQARPKK